jgi:hypothetical protein
VPEAETAVAEPLAVDPDGDAPEAPDTATETVAEPVSKGKDKAGKEKKSKKKGKESEESESAAEPGGAPSIAAHPRATRSVAQAKGWGALIGFTLGGYLSLPTHTFADAGLRALAAGAILYVAAWAVAVFAWRRLVMIEIKAREAELLAAVQAARSRRQGAGPDSQRQDAAIN